MTYVEVFNKIPYFHQVEILGKRFMLGMLVSFPAKIN